MDAVVLLHGIWMRPLIMRPLAARLRKAGFQCWSFAYPSLRNTPACNARLLKEFVDTITTPRLHFVAHSLGGIVLMHYFNLYNSQRPGRVVMLGSPLTGSDTARDFYRLPFARLALGKSIDHGLLGDIPGWSGSHELGVIAGTRPIGIRNLLGRSGRANDGAVFVSETQIAMLTDHISLPVSHTGMLLSERVAGQVIHFLHNGRFSLTMQVMKS